MSEIPEFNFKLVHTIWIQVPKLLFLLLSDILINRMLGPELKGAYAIFKSNGGLLLLVFNLGLPAAFIYYLGNDKYKADQLLSWAQQILIPIGVLSVLFCLFAYYNNWNALFYPAGFEQLIYVLYYLLIVLSAVAELLFRSFLIGRKKIEAANLIEVFLNLFRLVVLIFILIFYQDLPNLLFWVLILQLMTFLGGALSYRIYIALYLKIKAAKTSFSSIYFKQLFQYAAFLYLAAIVQFFNYKLDYWFIQYFHGEKDLGYYSTATEFAQFVWIASQSISLVMFPYLSASKREEVRRAYFYPLFKLNIIIGLLFLSLCLLLPADLVRLFYGPAFLPAASILVILVIATVVLNIARLLAIYASALGQPQFNFYASLFGFALTILFDLLLIPKMGIKGAALATCLSYGGLFLVLLWLSMRQYQFSLKELFIPGSKDWKAWKELGLLLLGKQENRT